MYQFLLRSQGVPMFFCVFIIGRNRKGIHARSLPLISSPQNHELYVNFFKQVCHEQTNLLHFLRTFSTAYPVMSLNMTLLFLYTVYLVLKIGIHSLVAQFSVGPSVKNSVCTCVCTAWDSVRCLFNFVLIVQCIATGSATLVLPLLPGTLSSQHRSH